MHNIFRGVKMSILVFSNSTMWKLEKEHNIHPSSNHTLYTSSTRFKFENQNLRNYRYIFTLSRVNMSTLRKNLQPPTMGPRYPFSILLNLDKGNTTDNEWKKLSKENIPCHNEKFPDHSRTFSNVFLN